MRRCCAVLLALGVGSPVGWTAPSPRSIHGSDQDPQPLGEPLARSTEGFTHVFDAVELADGRVLLTDSRDDQISIVDFARGSVDPVGRRGEGPTEYLSAFSILPRPDGGFDVYDARQRRFVEIDGSGRVTGVRSFTRPAVNGMSAPRGPDASGNLYFDSRVVGERGLEREGHVYRWHPASAAAEAVTVLHTFAPGQEGRGLTPMPRADAWSVLPDGSVARVVAEDYHVEWFGGRAGAVRGPSIDHPRIRVDAARRTAWIEALYAAPAAGATVVGGSGRSSGSSPATRSPIEEGRFPDYVPPFERGYQPAAPWGEIWLRLEVASDARSTTFDVLGRDGRLLRRTTVPGHARVVGFGDRAVYLVVRDAVDLEWLEKYPAGR